jgi:hypothetical protein
MKVILLQRRRTQEKAVITWQKGSAGIGLWFA